MFYLFLFESTFRLGTIFHPNLVMKHYFPDLYGKKMSIVIASKLHLSPIKGAEEQRIFNYRLDRFDFPMSVLIIFFYISPLIHSRRYVSYFWGLLVK